MNQPIHPPAMLQRLRPAEKVNLVFEILTSYVAMWRVMRLHDVRQMAVRARQVAPRSSTAEHREHLEARRLGKMVGKMLGMLPTDSRCLIRSLVLVRVLARRSIPSRIVIGVRRGPEFEAHAWVEHGGAPILAAGEFTRLMEL